ncbi:MAG: hypothetical protein KJO65_10940, partial [Gemmatimonadetes bacterium]|nr:hypothetical protein [Gemmatimonadota bacterium]
PPFRGMIADALGYLWIDLGYEEDVSRRRHLIVGPDLEPHGVMTLPDLPCGGYLAEARSLPQAPRPLTLEPRR